MYRDPKCVFIADTIGLAEVVVVWLGEHGIPAQVMNLMTLGGLEGLTALLPGTVSSRGMEVWVKDPSQAAEARQLLADFKALKETDGAAGVGTIEALCEECGTASLFPAKERGSVQSCPHCGAYMDVTDEPPEPDGEQPDDEGEG